MSLSESREIPLGFPRPPRSVRLKPKSRLGAWAAGGLMVALSAFGLFFLYETMKPPITLALGGDATGRVERVTLIRGRSSNGRRVEVVFTYQLPDGTVRFASGQIDKGDRKPPTVGQMLPIRVLRLGGLHFAEPRDDNTGQSDWVCAGPFMLIWCGMLAFHILAGWRSSVAARMLVREGTAVKGTVVGVSRRRSGRTKGCEILYRFTTPDKQVRSAVQVAASRACDQFFEGQSITVLYEETRSNRSTIYEASDYQIIL